MNINKELTYSKLTSFDKVLSGMQVNYFFIILMFIVVLWVPVSIMTVLNNIKHLCKRYTKFHS